MRGCEVVLRDGERFDPEQHLLPADVEVLGCVEISSSSNALSSMNSPHTLHHMPSPSCWPRSPMNVLNQFEPVLSQVVPHVMAHSTPVAEMAAPGCAATRPVTPFAADAFGLAVFL